MTAAAEAALLVDVNIMDGNKSTGTRPQSSSPEANVVAGLRDIPGIGVRAARGQCGAKIQGFPIKMYGFCY